MAVNEQGHKGKYSGNSRHCYNHAHTEVTSENYEATKHDDEKHMEYLKEDVKYDDHHGHSDINMTADEKHISKLAGDLKYDEKHHGAGRIINTSKKKDLANHPNVIEHNNHAKKTNSGFHPTGETTVQKKQGREGSMFNNLKQSYNQGGIIKTAADLISSNYMLRDS